MYIHIFSIMPKQINLLEKVLESKQVTEQQE